jgi:hypothetical protein
MGNSIHTDSKYPRCKGLNKVGQVGQKGRCQRTTKHESGFCKTHRPSIKLSSIKLSKKSEGEKMEAWNKGVSWKKDMTEVILSVVNAIQDQQRTGQVSPETMEELKYFKETYLWYNQHKKQLITVDYSLLRGQLKSLEKATNKMKGKDKERLLGLEELISAIIRYKPLKRQNWDKDRADYI